ncbi:hypothetical protein CDEN61S_01024 [Castellaniella denitrificans]|uniref:hypothetical protein n=1 Tax=Castellaniella sp. TaxID=1955812 RepID=UPI003D14318D
MPFAVGSLLLPLFGIAPFFDLQAGHLILALFLAFEWGVLTGMGLFYDAAFHNLRVPTWRISHLYSYGIALRWGALLLIIISLVYAANILCHVLAAPSVADYFLGKRARALAGGGVSATNPFIYRAINFSMAHLLLCATWRYFSRGTVVMPMRMLFFALLIASGLTSLLEGNRSTLIVVLIALMCFIYVYYLVSTKIIIFSGMAFMIFFILSMQIFRLGGDFSLEGLGLAFRWFVVYAFGSLVSFSDFINQHILTFWYAFDIGAGKFGARFAEAVGARDFFIIDYVRIGDLSTNVYSGYAVLYDYLGGWAALFITLKSAAFYCLKWLGRRSFIGAACYIALLASYPLTIYHEFSLTALYYCLVILEWAAVLWLWTCFIRMLIGVRARVPLNTEIRG